MIICFLKQTKLKYEDRNTASKRMKKKMCHTSSTQKEASATILISVKVDFDTKSNTGETEKYFIMTVSTIKMNFQKGQF